MQYQILFSIPFLILEILKKYVCVRSTKLIPVRSARYLDGWPNTNTPCCNTFFFPFLSPSFPKAILTTAELPSLCNVVSSIYQLFVPHFTMAVFLSIYLHYRINKQRDKSFKFSSILSTVDLQNINHGLNRWKSHAAHQFRDFQCLLFLFRQSSMVN